MKAVGPDGRRVFFNLYKDAVQMNMEHGTRLLANELMAMPLCTEKEVRAINHQGILSVQDFDILAVKVDEMGHTKFNNITRNVKDSYIIG